MDRWSLFTPTTYLFTPRFCPLDMSPALRGGTSTPPSFTDSPYLPYIIDTRRIFSNKGVSSHLKFLKFSCFWCMFALVGYPRPGFTFSSFICRGKMVGWPSLPKVPSPPPSSLPRMPAHNPLSCALIPFLPIPTACTDRALLTNGMHPISFTGARSVECTLKLCQPTGDSAHSHRPVCSSGVMSAPA